MPESESGALPTWRHPNPLLGVNLSECTKFIQSCYMGWIIGVEPTTSRATIQRSNQLSYTHQILSALVARLKRFELLTHCLEGSCSIQLSYRRINMVERVMGIEPTRPAWKAGILAIELHPQFLLHSPTLIIITTKHHNVKYFFKFLQKNSFVIRL